MQSIREVDELAEGSPAFDQWRDRITQRAAQRATPHDYWQDWRACFAAWDVERQGPVPMWLPTRESARQTNLAQFMQRHRFDSYAALHDWSTESPGDFWRQVAVDLDIAFRQPFATALSLESGVTRPEWFPGARMNIVDTCLNRAGDYPAIVAGSVDGALTIHTMDQLRQDVDLVARSLRAAGFEPGDRVAIVMPMLVESVAIYLGLVQAGCVAVSIADSFAPAEIARRLEIANAKGVFCVHSYRRGDKVMAIHQRIRDANGPRAIVLENEAGQGSLRPVDQTWEDFLQSGRRVEPHVASPSDPINILFSSGTTGDPKAIPWTHVTPIKCISDGYFHHDIQRGDVVVWPTNLGWMMGPWLIFAALGNGATIGLFDDVTQASAFGRFVQDAKVTMLGVVPTLVRHWRASRAMEGLNWSRLRCFSSTGEVSNAEDMFYLSSLAGIKPVIEYCGGTEIGGGYITSSLVHPNVPGAFSCPAMGNRFVILNEQGQPNDDGELFLVPPALGLSTSLLNRNHDETYFAGCPIGPHHETLRRHGDYFRRQVGGTYVAGGRVDDTMNLGGIKVSSAEIEQVLNQMAEVSETAAIAVSQAGQGPDELIVFVVPADLTVVQATQEDQTKWEAELCLQFNELLKRDLNPLFRVAKVKALAQLPRTTSNKVMRRELRTFCQRNAPTS